MCTLLQGVQWYIPTSRSGLFSQSYRNDKKRAGEGVKVLPPTITSTGDGVRQVEESASERVRQCVSGEQQGHAGESHPHRPDGTQRETGTHVAKVKRVWGDAESSRKREICAIYRQVASKGRHNYEGASIPVPSGLLIPSWRRFLDDYHDDRLVDYLEFGWPINFAEGTVLQSTLDNHPSATQHSEHLDYYVQTELGHGALLSQFEKPPMALIHISPLLTRDKKDSDHRRVIMDLSWPPGGAVNDSITAQIYVDGPGTISLPTVDYMEQRL